MANLLPNQQRRILYLLLRISRSPRCARPIFRSPPLIAALHTTPARCGYKITSNIKDCYQLLRVEPEADDDELKEAYLKLAKEYHPDSRTHVSDPKKFNQVQEAYRTIKAHRIDLEARMTGALSQMEDDDDDKFDIKHKAPQHRQFLNNEGVGYGTPSQRQKQYQQYKVSRAADAVTNRRISLIQSQYEDALLVQDKKATKKRTVRSGMERLVEDLIQESMSKGEFDDLPGKGKPLSSPQDQNPMVDTLTFNLNKIVIDQGFAPEWVRLSKDSRTELAEARTKLKHARIRAGPAAGTKDKAWLDGVALFRSNMVEVNKKIDRLNMLAPTMGQQQVRYNVDNEIKKISEWYSDQVAKGQTPQLPQVDTPPARPKVQFPSKEKTSAKNIWKDIKGLFSSS